MTVRAENAAARRQAKADAAQAEIDAYTAAGIADLADMEVARKAGWAPSTVARFRDCGVDLAGMQKIHASNQGGWGVNMMWLTVVQDFAKAGIRDVDDMLSLKSSKVQPGAVAVYRELGITDLDDLKVLGEAGVGQPQHAADARYCQFNSVDKILGAVEAGKANGTKLGYWHNVHMDAKDLGEFGDRLLQSHPLPATTMEVMSRSTVLQEQLDRLGDGDLRTVVSLIEMERHSTIKDAKALIKLFTP